MGGGCRSIDERTSRQQEEGERQTQDLECFADLWIAWGFQGIILCIRLASALDQFLICLLPKPVIDM